MRDRLGACLHEHIEEQLSDTVSIEHHVTVHSVSKGADGTVDIRCTAENGGSGTINTPFMV